MQKAILILLLCLLTFKADAQALAGKEFICGFMENEVNQGSTLIVYLASDRYATVDITIPLQGYAVTINLVPDTVIDVTIPLNLAAHAGSEIIEGKAIFISASDSILVYLLHRHNGGSDGTVVFPSNILSSEYNCITYRGIQINNTKSEFLLLAKDSNTQVTIFSSDTTTGGQIPGTSFNILLHKGQSYQVQSIGDLTGTKIVSSHQLALFSGNKGVHIPYFVPPFCCADHLFEQMLPVNFWGNEYITTPLMSRDSGDTYRIIAKDDSTIVYLNGVVTDTLNAGKFCEWRIKDASVISADKPVLVTQYANSQNFDGTFGDPFMITLIPAGNWYSKTIFKTYNYFAGNFSYYVNIITRSNWTSSFILNGVPILSSIFNPIQGSSYSYTTLQVPDGIHKIETDSGMLAYFYAFESNYESYGMALPGYDFNFTTGIKPAENFKTKITVYPNPLSGNELHVSLTGMPVLNGHKVSVTDVYGREILNTRVAGENKFKVTLPPLESGIYLLRLLNDKNAVIATSLFNKSNSDH